MKRYIFLLLLLSTSAWPQNSNAAPFDIAFQKADNETVAIIEKLLPSEIAEEKQDANSSFRKQYHSVFLILAARAKISESQPPYLFVMFPGGSYCGNINCSIWGFEPTKGGWRKVFQGIGEKWTVLSSTHGGRHDISERKHGGGNLDTKLVFRWTSGKYRPISN